MATYYRVTTESASGEYNTFDIAYESLTAAKVHLFEWFMEQTTLVALTLYRYLSDDCCGPYTQVDEVKHPSNIYF